MWSEREFSLEHPSFHLFFFCYGQRKHFPDVYSENVMWAQEQVWVGHSGGVDEKNTVGSSHGGEPRWWACSRDRRGIFQGPWRWGASLQSFPPSYGDQGFRLLTPAVDIREVVPKTVVTGSLVSIVVESRPGKEGKEELNSSSWRQETRRPEMSIKSQGLTIQSALLCLWWGGTHPRGFTQAMQVPGRPFEFTAQWIFFFN